MERAAGVSGAAQVVHAGGCHCGSVRFEVTAPADLELLECNCSMCARSRYLHLIVDAGAFRLLRGAGELTEYAFGSRMAKHRFCRRCGVKSFYVPRSHPDGISVNARCLDPGTVSSARVSPFDGRDWERARAGLGSG